MMHVLLEAVKVKKANVCTLKSAVTSITLRYFEIFAHTEQTE
jgi:hypothetical protein